MNCQNSTSLKYSPESKVLQLIRIYFLCRQFLYPYTSFGTLACKQIPLNDVLPIIWPQRPGEVVATTPGPDTLLRSKVSGGRLTSKWGVRGATYFGGRVTSWQPFPPTNRFQEKRVLMHLLIVNEWILQLYIMLVLLYTFIFMLSTLSIVTETSPVQQWAGQYQEGTKCWHVTGQYSLENRCAGSPRKRVV